ncbi:MAG: hypothetical protein EOO43_15800, partial [Flavobacterium sp.]
MKKIDRHDSANILINIEGEKSSDTMKKDALKFAQFEELVKNEEDIPIQYLKTYVKGLDSSLLDPTSKFTGKNLIHSGDYRLFHIQQGSGGYGNAILISYQNASDKQIDVKVFLSYCEVCPRNYNSTIIFPSIAANFLFMVKYYEPSTSKAMPDPNTIEIIKSEKWIMPNGKM